MKSEAKRSVFWSGIENLTTRGINFLITIIIARLLTPEDYGLVAMLSVFYAVAQAFIDSGLGSALVQKKDCTQKDYNSVFLFSVSIAVLLYIILFTSAPLIARLYHNELLIKMSRVYLFSLVISSVGIVPQTIMQKDLRFKDFALISFVASGTSGVVAIILAYLGMEYWALVFQTLITATIATVIYYIKSKWRPTFYIDIDSIKSMLSYGVPVMMSALLQAVYNNIYSLVIGAKYTSRDLGLYNRAYSYSSTVPINFSNFSMTAMFPVLAKGQNSIDSLQNVISDMLHMSFFVVLPINMYIVFNASDIVSVTLGMRWIELVPFLIILSIGTMSYVFTNMHNCVFKVTGKTKPLFASELTRKMAGVLVLILTVPYGVEVMVYGALGFAVLDYLISSLFLKKFVGIGLLIQIKSVITPLLFSLLSGLVCLCFSTFVDRLYMRFTLCTFAFFICYLLLAYIFKDKGLSFIRHFFK